jgi:hypothetical protein
MTAEPQDRPAESRVLRVAGPLVEIGYTPGTAMNDMVALGDAGLPGEVVAIRGDVVTVQSYEYTGGLAPGHPAPVCSAGSSTVCCARCPERPSGCSPAPSAVPGRTAAGRSARWCEPATR